MSELYPYLGFLGVLAVFVTAVLICDRHLDPVSKALDKTTAELLRRDKARRQK